jgi:cobalt-zinc-cadmium efflux system outer membrane protein
MDAPVRQEGEVMSPRPPRLVTRFLLALLPLLPSAVRGQAPTIVTPHGETTVRGGLLGPAPGALNALDLRVQGGQSNQPISGAVGPSGTRAPASISVPPSQVIQPPEVMRLPTPLQLPSPPSYGTLDFPSVAEDIGPEDGLTLDEAIERLVRDNLQLKGQFMEIPQAEADVLTASLRANPVLYADSQLLPYGSFSRNRPGGPTQYDLNISYPLDITRKRQARTQVARRVKCTIEFQFQNEVRKQIGNLATAYVGVVASRQRLRYAQASLVGLDQILQPLGEQEIVGRITAADVNRVRLQRETAALLVNDAEEALKQSKRDLATLLNIPHDESSAIEIRSSIRVEAPPPPPIDALIEIALVERPDLTAYRMGLQRAEAEVHLARANRMNDIFVLFQPYTFQDNAPIGLKSATAYAFGVTVPLPLYNHNQGNLQRARLNVNQTQIEIEDLARRIVNEVQQAEREYHVSRGALERIDTRLRPAAQQVLDTVRRQYDEGSIGVIEFITARQEYNQVVRQYLDTLVRYRLSMLSLNTAVGRRILP